MAEEAEVEVETSSTSRPEQQAPHFLQDVIFHGKFKVSVSMRDKLSEEEPHNENCPGREMDVLR